MVAGRDPWRLNEDGAEVLGNGFDGAMLGRMRMRMGSQVCCIWMAVFVSNGRCVCRRMDVHTSEEYPPIARIQSRRY